MKGSDLLKSLGGLLIICYIRLLTIAEATSVYSIKKYHHENLHAHSLKISWQDILFWSYYPMVLES